MYIVITGTSRGIGLELVKTALDKKHDVLAIARNPENSPELLKLKQNNSKLEIFTCDINHGDAENKIYQKVKDWPHVDVLINNAGIYKDDNRVEDFQDSFLTNSIKPYFLAKSLREKMKGSNRPISVQITSQMGSIADNTSGGSYSYRASKAALNMLFKSFSVDEPWLISLLIHPGWVQTRMGGSSAPVTPRDSAMGIWNIIEMAKHSDSGKFLDFRNNVLPW